ncbi:hypothetical protein ABIF00_006729 [Bradyrhizobium elkanii]
MSAEADKTALTAQDARNIELVQQYFRKGDAMDPEIMKLFHPELQFYFPKFGIGRGPNTFLQFVSSISGQIEAFGHRMETFLYVARDPYVVVEGTTMGKIEGKEWEGGKTPGGRFANVFEIRDNLIKRCHIYLDPDYTSEDEPRFRWGREGREW